MKNSLEHVNVTDSVNLLINKFVCVCDFPQAFELATGDYLFEPHSGEDYSRDEG